MARWTFASFFEHLQPDPQLISLVDNNTYYGSGVDMTGYSGVVFFAQVGQGEVANYDLKVQQDTDSAFGTAADLAGTKVTFATGASADGFAFVDVRNPAERYVRPALVAPNITTPISAAIFAIRYGKKDGPETNADGELHDAPAEGTA
jgi:hypothetical protein